MATVHLSRKADDPAKRYSGLHLQLGRVFYEDDWNEREEIADEEQRRELLDLIGAAGSPDAGFLVAAPSVIGGELDFTLKKGTLYVAGQRLRLFADEHYRTQLDYLRQPKLARELGAPGEYDLVYLEVWDQFVGAFEDGELLEVALGGADTAVRKRTMRRVKRRRVVSDDCERAFKTLADDLAAAHQGVLDASGELSDDAELRVDFDPAAVAQNLCAPSVVGGYLGAENQALRVELREGSKLLWGFDNASALYRASLNGDVVTFENLPKDETQWPLAGQVVEILPWSAILPNGEKLAELEGHVSRVLQSFDPESRQLVLETAPAPDFGQEWTLRPDSADVALSTIDDGTRQSKVFFYVRVWDRGSDRTSDALLSYAPNSAVVLGHTGLSVTVSGNQRATGDYWIIAARPDSPHQIVPWSLRTGRIRHGTRRYFTPLALIKWNPGPTPELVCDCREPFNPLTRLRGCCSYVVGEGGHYPTIQEAVNQLPTSGGEICVLPGEYAESVLLNGKRQVTIHGCGERTVVRPGPKGGPIFQIVDGHEIKLERMRLATQVNHAIVVEAKLERGAYLKKHELDETRVLIARDLQIEVGAHAALHATEVAGLELSRTRIFAGLDPRASQPDAQSGWPAVFVKGARVLIAHNVVRAEGGDEKKPGALGGIQIAGASIDVELRHNRIVGGDGDGIVLGSVVYEKNARDLFDVVRMPTRFGRIIVIDGCLVLDPFPPTFPGDDPPSAASEGPLRDIRICQNRIRAMGSTGIGVAAFFDLERDGSTDAILIRGLLVEQNSISGCLRIERRELSNASSSWAGHGAIALADVDSGTFRGNEIAHCGVHPGEAVCGMFILSGTQICVENNQISDVGVAPSPDRPARRGFRGGVVGSFRSGRALYSARAASGAALIVQGNRISSSYGPALHATGSGLMQVHGNVLRAVGASNPTSIAARDVALRFSPNSPLRAFSGAFGAAVLVHNSGLSRDLHLLNVDYEDTALERASFGRELAVSAANTANLLKARSLLEPGPVSFHDNHVHWDSIAGERPCASVTALLSQDDVSVQGNEHRSTSGVGAIAFADLAVFGATVRVSSNRLIEAPSPPPLSAVTVARANITTNNQSTRCLQVVGQAGLTINAQNLVLQAAGSCKNFDVLATNWAQLAYR